jgi:4-diphosphocytidyl-2-C-methyl-D-erythritol kinase
MSTLVRSYAKINIGLCIGPPGMRADGFHELRTVYQTIALHDRVTVEIQDREPPSRSIRIRRHQEKDNTSLDRGNPIQILCNDARVPTDSANTCWHAAERMIAALAIDGPVRITIDKRLPVQGGLGAASSNAVATMVGIEREWAKRRRGGRGRKRARSGLTPEERLRIAEEIGSDVPLFLIGGTVMGMGRGEQVVPLPDLPETHVVVATPPVGVSTPAAFAAWDRQFDSPTTEGTHSPFASGDEVTEAIARESAERAQREVGGQLRLTPAGQSV